MLVSTVFWRVRESTPRIWTGSSATSSDQPHPCHNVRCDLLGPRYHFPRISARLHMSHGASWPHPTGAAMRRHADMAPYSGYERCRPSSGGSPVCGRVETGPPRARDQPECPGLCRPAGGPAMVHAWHFAVEREPLTGAPQRVGPGDHGTGTREAPTGVVAWVERWCDMYNIRPHRSGHTWSMWC